MLIHALNSAFEHHMSVCIYVHIPFVYCALRFISSLIMHVSSRNKNLIVLRFLNIANLVLITYQQILMANLDFENFILVWMTHVVHVQCGLPKTKLNEINCNDINFNVCIYNTLLIVTVDIWQYFIMKQVYASCTNVMQRDDACYLLAI